MLDVGSGSGYLCAVLHHLVSDSGTSEGKVIGIEHIPELVEWSTSNLRRDGLGKALDDGRIVMVNGDGRKGTSVQARRICIVSPQQCPSLLRCGTVVIGYPEAGKTLQFLPCCIPPSTYVRPAPFDAIHVGAAAPTLPAALVDQLSRPGRMFIPVGTHTQQVLQVRFRSSAHAYLSRILICSYYMCYS